MATDDGPGLRRTTDDEAFYEDIGDLLTPGDISLQGAVVHTGLTTDDESFLHQRTLDIGETVADHVTPDAVQTYVYSGNDDPEFGLNQHQGLTLATDEFVWECQQLLRSGTFDIVIYWEAIDEVDLLLADLEQYGERVVGITETGPRRNDT